MISRNILTCLQSKQEKDKTHFTDKDTGVELELEESMPFLEWLANNYKNFGATLEIITGMYIFSSQKIRDVNIIQ